MWDAERTIYFKDATIERTGQKTKKGKTSITVTLKIESDNPGDDMQELGRMEPHFVNVSFACNGIRKDDPEQF